MGGPPKQAFPVYLDIETLFDTIEYFSSHLVTRSREGKKLFAVPVFSWLWEKKRSQGWRGIYFGGGELEQNLHNVQESSGSEVKHRKGATPRFYLLGLLEEMRVSAPNPLTRAEMVAPPCSIHTPPEFFFGGQERVNIYGGLFMVNMVF